MNDKPSKSMIMRVFICMLVIVIAASSISIIRLIDIAVINGDKYRNEALEQQLYDTLLAAPRGNIYDKNMNTLATSSTAWTVYITPNGLSRVKDAEKKQKIKNTIADGLSEILGVERDTVYAQTEKNTYYVIVKKKIDKVTADKVRKFISDNSDLNLASYVGLDETTKRYYPNDNLASVVLGFVGSDNQGLSGIESYYDTKLTGVAGRVVAAKSAQGVDMPLTYERVEEAVQGNSLVLTIDNYIQYIAEKYLEEGVLANQANGRGACIVMNVNSGEILAMAIKGDFDPNEPFTLSTDDQAKIEAETDTDKKSELKAKLQNLQWRNKAVSDTYEPGSVFKVITAAMALEENLVNTNSTFTCAYHINIAGQGYDCHKKGGHGTQNLIETMVNSCNPAYIMIGQLVGSSSFAKYFDAFGLTKKTGIDLPGESNSVYHAESKMGPVELASSSFGQTFKITPIQMITAVSAAVNGGYLVKPHLVSKVLDSEGNVVETVNKTVKRQVISSTTSETIRTMMGAVVSKSTSKNMYVAGYQTGGKTGTSQKVAEKLESGSDKELYIASYLAVAPIDEPEIAVLVMIDEPSAGQYYGSAVAAPIGAEILSGVLPYLGYEPQYTESELASLSISVPNVIGEDVAVAKGKVTSAKLNYKIVGSGSKVVNQMPSSTDSLHSGGVVILYTEEIEEGTNKATVPDFTGLSLSSVNATATNAGLNVQFAGNTSTAGVVAYKQSIEPNESVDKGSVITVYFRDTSADNIAD
ncbi:MAG: PASTA domain-containing protein [Ruminococcaceae bacterium]|nr:PASTA domain-containing protein [Oscillospiraceae bacterium]